MPKFFTSLNGCVKSILDKETNLADVEFVIISTTYYRYETMVDLITRSFMGPQREQATSIATTLWHSGRVFQSTVPTDSHMAGQLAYNIPKVFKTVVDER